ncbi:MAG: hypothetical protein K6F05_09320 [Succinivibrio sp.]|nr:hypothetical protein [Succinivibrio sp.]
MAHSSIQNTLSSDEIKVLEMMGFFFISMGMLDKAVKIVNGLSVLDPKNEWAGLARAYISFAFEDYDTTIILTDKLLRQDNVSHKDEILKLKARSLYKLKREDEAMQIMQAFID